MDFMAFFGVILILGFLILVLTAIRMEYTLNYAQADALVGDLQIVLFASLGVAFLGLFGIIISFIK